MPGSDCLYKILIGGLIKKSLQIGQVLYRTTSVVWRVVLGLLCCIQKNV